MIKKLTKDEFETLQNDYYKWFDNVACEMEENLLEALDVNDEDYEEFEDEIRYFREAILAFYPMETREEAEKCLKEKGWVE